MTKLEFAFAEAAKLPPKDQEALANWILEEITSDKRWTESFASSEDLLILLAEEAVAEYRAGKTIELDPGKL